MKNKTRKRNIWQPASYTVEAAFLFPLLLFVMLACLVIAFSLRDRMAVTSLFWRAAKEGQMFLCYGSDPWEQRVVYEERWNAGVFDRWLPDREEQEAVLEERLAAVLASRSLWSGTLASATVEIAGGDLCLQGILSFGGGMAQMFFGANTDTKVVVVLPYGRRTTAVRAMTAALETVSEIPAAQEVLAYLQTLIEIRGYGT